MSAIPENTGPFTTSKVARAWREGGLGLVIRRTAHVALGPWIDLGFVEFFVKELQRTDDTPAVDGVVFDQASPAEAGLLLMDRPQPDVVARDIRTRFERGDHCVVARSADGRILHTRWISTRATLVPELDRCVVPGAGQAYMYDGYTRPEARGRGIDGAVRRYIFATMRAAGIREVLSYVRGTNGIGLRAAAKWQTSVGRARYLRIRGVTRWVFASRALRRCLRLIAPASAAAREAERESRAHALKDWFNSWLVEPMEKRSTGFSALPDAYFESAGAHIVATLQLDPTRDEVLDVGCASGGISRHVAPSARRFVGVDLTAGLIADIVPGSIRTATGAAAEFSVADARSLPFTDDAFDKVYCTGVIHMLPDHDDAIQAIDEMVRVCRPGGMVLLGAVPDRAKRSDEIRLLWRKADMAGKAKLIAALLVPAAARRTLRRLLRRPTREVAFLKFDLARLKADLELQGLRSEILDYPADFWSEDFRTTRTCLLLRLPT